MSFYLGFVIYIEQIFKLIDYYFFLETALVSPCENVGSINFIYLL